MLLFERRVPIIPYPNIYDTSVSLICMGAQPIVNIELHVSKIRVQKDKYRSMDGKSLGETVFWQSTDNEAEVLQFKRAIATCQILGPNFVADFDLIISLRAGFARVRTGKRGHSAEKLAK